MMFVCIITHFYVTKCKEMIIYIISIYARAAIHNMDSFWEISFLLKEKSLRIWGLCCAEN